MPTVQFDGQSFTVKGRRIWLTAAEFDYALAPRDTWSARLRAARSAGCNAIVANCPWGLHEPRPGRLTFEGNLDLGALAELCATEELWLILRIGPVVAGTYDGGGLPAWLADLPGVRVREAHQPFFERVIPWFRAVADRVRSFQATELRSKGAHREVGPLVAVQIEHDWACGSPNRATSYLDELVRFVREVGFNVPVLTANRAWATTEASIDTWSGWDDLGPTLRQLATLSPDHPRLIDLRSPASLQVLRAATAANRRSGAGAASADARLADATAIRCAQVLANGGQLLLGDAFSAVHHRATNGRVTVGDGPRGYLASTARQGTLFDEDGSPREGSGLLRRIVSFAGSFGHLFAQCDPSRQGVVADPDGGRQSIVPVTGPGGTAIMVFADRDRPSRSVTLLLPDGRRLQALTGSEPVSWFVLEVDLLGAGVLDYATIPPLALLERRQLVLSGPAGAEAEVSIDGVPLTIRIPVSGAVKPTVVAQKRVTVVVCNDEQAAHALATPEGMVFGASSMDSAGAAVLAAGQKSAHRVNLDGTFASLPTSDRRRSAPIPVGEWTIVPCRDLVEGTSQRYATLDGPTSLSACGARDGCGWYRLRLRRSSAMRILLHAPSLADRATIWRDGTAIGTFGSGPGAERFPLPLTLPAGERRLAMLVEHLGRPIAGDHLGRRTGLYGPLLEVAALKVTAKRARGNSVDPFALRGFVYGATEGDLGAGEALVWSFQHRKKTALLLDLGELGEVDAHAERRGLPGTLLVNGTPVARIGEDGPDEGAITLDSAAIPSLKPGAVELRLVLDGEPDEKLIAALARGTKVYEILQSLSGAPAWGFARWAPPDVWTSGAKPVRGTPVWMRGVATIKGPPQALWLDCSELGTGHAFVNGRSLGRYAVRSADGASTGPQRGLPIPASWLVEGANEIVLFDTCVYSAKGVTLRSEPLNTRSDARSS